ncbi:keratin-like protein KRT222 isoform X2 [Denticeps clupeoides]|uniref:IF rod domain-containing protein n=1 Tax=Denticeps clupeoides TaxID=299321 RepID=A0AAY4DES0_9TELE|nr:keratin-like protein KRT222 isoform X2 [Denticeps clupeoides]
MEKVDDAEWALRGLNDRLRDFLAHVNRLREANCHLEQQILEWGRKNVFYPHDWTEQERIIQELRAQISSLLMENAQLALQSDNFRSRASNLRTRYEVEQRETGRLQQQMMLLKETLKEAEQANRLQEVELSNVRDERKQMQEDHEEALALQQQQQQASHCDDALARWAVGEDGRRMELSQLLDRIRVQCERIGAARGPNPATGLSELESSNGAAAACNGASVAQQRAEATWAQVIQGEEALREARAELADARKQWHSLQIEIESLHALEKGLETSLHTTQHQYSSQLQDLSQVVQDLEGELESVREGLANQRQRHNQLLNTKMRLEGEITTYRKLLDSEEGRYFTQEVKVGGLKPWRGSIIEVHQNGIELSPDDPEEVQPITKFHTKDFRKSPAILKRQKSLVILTEPDGNKDVKIATVRTQILQGNMVQESAEGHTTVEAEKIDTVIKQWEGSFFKGNPKLRKKSVSLRFDLHMAVASEASSQAKPDGLTDVEVRLVMKRSRSISSITP